MSITSIGRIQHRRGLLADLPQSLSEGEFGWCLDTRELFIGNGPGYGGNSEILTEHSPNGQLITNQFKTVTSILTSAAVRPLSEKLNDVASVLDFGATGLGNVDESNAINAAIVELLAGPYSSPIDRTKRIALRLPAGNYLIDKPLLMYPFLTLIGDGPGKTRIFADSNSNLVDLPYLMETTDNLGQTEANIGLDLSSTLPNKILIKDLTISTNGAFIDAVRMNRANTVRFENVEFIGAYTLGDNVSVPSRIHSAVNFQSIGVATLSYNLQFINCIFSNFTYAFYTDDPICHIIAADCKFVNLYRGANLGEIANYNGPSWTVISNSHFVNIDDSAIINFSSNPGVTSIGNFYHNIGLTNSVLPIVWESGTSLNTSSGDIFDSSPGVLDNGTINLIIDAQQNNLTALSGTTKDLVFNFSGIPAASATQVIPITKAGKILANAVGAEGKCLTAPTATWLFNLATTIGSNTIVSSGNITVHTDKSISWPIFSDLNMSPGDSLIVIATSSPDATGANVAFNFPFTLL